MILCWFCYDDDDDDDDDDDNNNNNNNDDDNTGKIGVVRRIYERWIYNQLWNTVICITYI